MVAEPGDELEVRLDNFVIDIRRGDLLIEVQTQSFAAMGRKLDALLDRYRIRIVHPVAVTTYLHRPSKPVRRSPKKGGRFSILDELVSVPTLIDHPKFSVDVVLMEVDRHQRHDPTARRGRGGWRTVDKRIRRIDRWERFETGTDILDLLPSDLPEVFTTADIAAGGDADRSSAQKLAYVLRALGLITLIDADRGGYRYRLASETSR
ncbi:MAG: hypothetical protein OES24_11280 [Acidimicrobiia bacterium]|nr:hypothetical protein [Acidimicrobiia bacterium]